MADNIDVTPGTGATVAADEIGGALYQRVKIAAGADGSATDVSDAAPLPVDDAGGSLTVDNGGTFAVQVDGMTADLPDTAAGDLAAINAATAAIQTAVEILDNIVSGSEAQVDVVSSALPTGAATSALQTSSEALLTTIDGDTSTLAGAVSGSEMQVDVVAALPAGDNNIGNVDIASAIPAGTNNIGDVDVLSVPGALQGPGNPTVDSFSSAAVDLAASTANQSLVAAPGASKQIWVYGLFMMADTAAGTVTLQDEDDTALSGTMAVSDEGGWVLPMSGNFAMPWIKVATNKALEADTGACTVDGIITYAIVSV